MKPLEFPGNNCEWDYGTAGFKVQSSQEALNSGLIFALSMKHFSKAVPDFVAGALYPDSILQNFLSQAFSPKPIQQQPLKGKDNPVLAHGLRHSVASLTLQPRQFVVEVDNKDDSFHGLGEALHPM
ncbi:UNVERIFIED_CONTAM: hypothetical protein K2H54_043968 [Gekko kuhli]